MIVVQMGVLAPIPPDSRGVSSDLKEFLSHWGGWLGLTAFCGEYREVDSLDNLENVAEAYEIADEDKVRSAFESFIPRYSASELAYSYLKEYIISPADTYYEDADSESTYIPSCFPEIEEVVEVAKRNAEKLLREMNMLQDELNEAVSPVVRRIK